MLAFGTVVEVASQAFDPFNPRSGTEHMAPLLYSLVRMTKPKSIVEYGSGYTTLFILAACAENVADAKEEARLLGEKTRNARSSIDWLKGGGKACNVDPAFYLQPFTPHVYCFE